MGISGTPKPKRKTIPCKTCKHASLADRHPTRVKSYFCPIHQFHFLDIDDTFRCNCYKNKELITLPIKQFKRLLMVI